MDQTLNNLAEDKKIYFASDFHLGAPSRISSKQREQKIVNWLSSIQDEASAIILIGDIFDFWFEYKYTIPKGYSLFLSKLSELRNDGIDILFFTGNHDLWMFDYFPTEYGIPVYKEPTSFEINGKKFYLAHGDGLGPGDQFYKFVKKFFTNKTCQWLFHWLHPNIGIWLAQTWSNRSRDSKYDEDKQFYGEDEWLIIHSRKVEKSRHHDYYIYGHRHLKADYELSKNCRYLNLGEWVTDSYYAVFHGSNLELMKFEG